MKGKFIMFEGGEGAGKSTLVQNLYDVLRSEGVDVVKTREPGGSPCAEEIREVLIRKRPEGEHMPTPRAQLLGHYTARADHLERTVLPVLKRGTIVLCDRFELSSYAYQVHAQEEGLEDLFKSLHKHTLELLIPYECIYIMCDIEPEEGVKRALKRKDDNTAFDEMDMSFHHKVRDGLKKGKDFVDPHFSFVEIDARRTEQEMVEDVRQALKL